MRVINPTVMLEWQLGILPAGDALLETTGRRRDSRGVRQCATSWRGETFWLVAERGRRADWVRNIQANLRVRVKVGGGPGVGRQTGTAHVLDDHDPRERERRIGRGSLARRLCVSAWRRWAPIR